MKILVTGGAGYLGTHLLPKLVLRNHDLRVLDLGYFGMGHLRGLHPQPELIREDLRRINSDDAFLQSLIQDVDCIVHLAAMSNDPTADLDPAYTEEVNTKTTITLADAAKRRGIKFIFASSCSVYGGSGELLDENSALGPLTTYAVSKMRAEEALREMETENWRPILLRFGTLFGYSARMRFDLVVNIFSLFSVLKNEIKVFGTGLHWRPFLHVRDCARAIAFFVEKRTWEHSTYNIAHENLRVVDVAAIFKSLSPSLNVLQMTGTNEDPRDYRVTTARVQAEGFQTRVSVEMGAEEMREALATGMIPDPESILYQNVKWLKELGLNPNPITPRHLRAA